MPVKAPIGSFVLIRTQNAGVHFGTLNEKDGQEVLLTNARRLWSWSGALSLSEIAMKGIDIPKSKISVPVDEIVLQGVIETIVVSKTSNLPGNEIPRKTASAKI